MKKKIIMLSLLILIVCAGGFMIFTLFNDNNKEENNANNENSNNESSNNENSGNETQTDSNINSEDITRIKLSFNNEEVYVQLNNSESSKDFVSMLPLTLDFEDYNNTEKISYLPKELTTENAPSGYTPQVGDFSYYVPWGNLSIFYKEFRYSNSLIKLGEFESGIEKLESMDENFKMTIEVVQ